MKIVNAFCHSLCASFDTFYSMYFLSVTILYFDRSFLCGKNLEIITI
jgi:hypothetical protein